jgi:fibro-slime domain-containing protein
LPIDKTNGQECDDGNTVSGDGCSADCKIERGFSCAPSQVVENPLRLPIVYRDFKAKGEPNGHPDFEQGDLHRERHRPGRALADRQAGARGRAEDDHHQQRPGANGFDYFAVWYKDDPNYNRPSPTSSPSTSSAPALPVQQRRVLPARQPRWGNYMGRDIGGRFRNFHFTSELRYWFEYRGGEQLDFTATTTSGVFINKRLVIDLGGVHQALDGGLILDASNGTARVCDLVSPCPNRRWSTWGWCSATSTRSWFPSGAPHHRVPLPLTRPTSAARRAPARRCAATPSSAAARPATWAPPPTPAPTAPATPTAPCRPAAGDGAVNGSEQCDDGVNAATYGGTNHLCGPGCVWAGFCGDGTKNGPSSATRAPLNNAAAYAATSAPPTCTTATLLRRRHRPRSGFGEECDSTPGCTLTCKKGQDPVADGREPRCGSGRPRWEARPTLDGLLPPSRPAARGRSGWGSHPVEMFWRHP